MTTRALARRLTLHPTLGWPIRLVRPGWPDAGRRVAQGGALAQLLDAARAALPRARTIVNAGAGEGLYAATIAGRFRDSALLEFDLQPPPSCRRAAAHHRLQASLTAIPLATGVADLVICTEVLEHIVDDRTAVAELRRVLRNGGFLLVSVPTPPAPDDPAHVREGYTAAELDALLRRAGFEIVEQRYSMYSVFQRVLVHWRAGRRLPLALILAMAWCDRLWPTGTPMDIAVLARAIDAGQPVGGR